GAIAPDSDDVDFAGDESEASQPGRERGRGLFGLLPSLIGNTNEAPEVKASAKEDQEEDEDYEEEESDEDVEEETDEEDLDEEDEDDSEVAEDEDDDGAEADGDEEESDDEEGDDDDDEAEEDKKPSISRQAPSKQAPRPLMLRRPAQPIGGSLRAAISIDDM